MMMEWQYGSAAGRVCYSLAAGLSPPPVLSRLCVQPCGSVLHTPSNSHRTGPSGLVYLAHSH